MSETPTAENSVNVVAMDSWAETHASQASIRYVARPAGEVALRLAQETSRGDDEQILDEMSDARAREARAGFHVVEQGEQPMTSPMPEMPAESGASPAVTQQVTIENLSYESSKAHHA